TDACLWVQELSLNRRQNLKEHAGSGSVLYLAPFRTHRGCLGFPCDGMMPAQDGVGSDCSPGG
ncbi:hypothetical protein CCH79_00016721, partial [Gambusia affinis]